MLLLSIWKFRYRSIFLWTKLDHTEKCFNLNAYLFGDSIPVANFYPYAASLFFVAQSASPFFSTPFLIIGSMFRPIKKRTIGEWDGNALSLWSSSSTTTSNKWKHNRFPEVIFLAKKKKNTRKKYSVGRTF